MLLTSLFTVFIFLTLGTPQAWGEKEAFQTERSRNKIVIDSGNAVGKRQSKLKTKTRTSGMVKAQGVLESAGMTVWQYGSHILTTELGKTYALTSDTIDLKRFEGKRVHIEGHEIAGYPVENGPPYVKVEILTVIK